MRECGGFFFVFGQPGREGGCLIDVTLRKETMPCFCLDQLTEDRVEITYCLTYDCYLKS